MQRGASTRSDPSGPQAIAWVSGWKHRCASTTAYQAPRKPSTLWHPGAIALGTGPDRMNISTLQMLALMASGLAIIVGITIATTSKSRLLKAGGYSFTAALIVAVAVAVFSTPTEDPETAQAEAIVSLLLLAAAGWVGMNAIRAYRRK
jgi:hypothetical protein